MKKLDKEAVDIICVVNIHLHESVTNDLGQVVNFWKAFPEQLSEDNPLILGSIGLDWFTPPLKSMSLYFSNSKAMPVKNLEGAIVRYGALPSIQYFVGRVLERNGDFEYEEKIIVRVPRKLTPDKFAAFSKWIAQDWRSSDDDDWDESCEGYWTSEQSLVFPFVQDCEVSVEESSVAKKYLTLFTYEAMQNEQ